MRVFNGVDDLRTAVGTTVGSSDWMTVEQGQIDGFADATHDHQWIHVDLDRAKEGPFGTPIAHGFLTLSLLTPLSASIPQDAARLDGIVMGVNYGFEKVRFVNPVKVGSRIRASAVLTSVDAKDANTLQVTKTYTVEIEGESKPALVADWVTRAVYS